MVNIVNIASRTVPSPDYRLAGGDTLEIQIAGRLETTKQQVVIDPQGTISVPPIGAVQLGGLSLIEAQRALTQQARELLRFVDVAVSLVAARCSEVSLSGEIEQPGVVQVSANRRVHDVILLVGGITPRGSLRRVQVTTRTGAAEVDLLRFELGGDLDQNPFVVDGMRIHVPSRGPTVTLAGAVRRPGEYELDPSGSLETLFRLVGGLAPAASPSQARLTRQLADGRKETVSVDLRTALARPADVRLQPYDLLFVPTVGLLQDVVEVRGAFNGTADSAKTTTAGKPTIVQRLELAQGDRVRDIVLRVGGAAPYADLRLALIERPGAGGPRQRIPIDLGRLLVEHDETQNVRLENGDVVLLPVTEDRVYVVGEVRSPGPFDFRTELTPREYVAMAGGPTNRAKMRATTVTFSSGRTYAMAEAPPLEAGAVVTVPEVALKWWQDYVTIAYALSQIIAAYTGIYILYRGPIVTTTP
ncbi:MAG: SLBB domain-containing protein [Candidatus Rokubacteria bacterium]|nr:SLBB domain-containing protein [Candidatus Rokubacteria bacterium]